jgi:hypothetical protein
MILCDGTDCRTLAADATGAVASALGQVGVFTLPGPIAGGLKAWPDGYDTQPVARQST